MKKLNFFVGFLVLIMNVIPLLAQNKTKYEFGKISNEEIKMMQYLLDSSADVLKFKSK